MGAPPSMNHQRLPVITEHPHASVAAFCSLLAPCFRLLSRGWVLMKADVRATWVWGLLCVSRECHSEDHDHSGKTLNWGSWAITSDDTNYPGKGHKDSGAEYAQAPDLDHEVRVHIRSLPRPLQTLCRQRLASRAKSLKHQPRARQTRLASFAVLFSQAQLR
jgi:hypothetical protein